MNIQPSEAEAGFDLRLPPTADPEEMRRRIHQEWAPSARNMSYEVKSPRKLICIFYLSLYGKQHILWTKMEDFRYGCESCAILCLSIS